MKKRFGERTAYFGRADAFLFPAINIVTHGELAISVWDFLILQRNQQVIGWLTLIGAVMFVPGLAIYLARLTLGKLFSKRLNLIEGHKLVTHGVYRYVRHPSYTGSILFWPGLTFLLNSVLGFTAMLLLVLLILIRIPFEEKMLSRAFGEQYIEYTKRTEKLIPFLY